jgi:hypothetical protein
MSKPDDTKPASSAPAGQDGSIGHRPPEAAETAKRKIEDVAAHALEPGNLERFRRS